MSHWKGRTEITSSSGRKALVRATMLFTSGFSQCRNWPVLYLIFSPLFFSSKIFFSGSPYNVPAILWEPLRDPHHHDPSPDSAPVNAKQWLMLMPFQTPWERSSYKVSVWLCWVIMNTGPWQMSWGISVPDQIFLEMCKHDKNLLPSDRYLTRKDKWRSENGREASLLCFTPEWQLKDTADPRQSSFSCQCIYSYSRLWLLQLTSGLSWGNWQFLHTDSHD